MKTEAEIKEVVERARKIVRELYADDPRLTGEGGPDAGVARETDIVFQEVLRYLLNSD